MISHPAVRLLLAACALSLPTAYSQSPASAPQALPLTGAYQGVHDPSIIQQGDMYYVFATGAAHARPSAGTSTPSAPSGTASSASLPQLPVRCSPDLRAWRMCGAVFPAGIPMWIRQASPDTKELWAPDISFYNGTYHLYYAYSEFGSNRSGIALATNKTLDQASPDFRWIDRGPVLQSKSSDRYNAIDPNLVLDQQDKPWLAFGSFWSGIKMRRLDRATGKPTWKHPRLYSLATRAKPAAAGPAKAGLPPNWQAVEAPFILRHQDYFYLFVSWDLCCRGTHSTYRTMVGRSRSVHGPYLDRSGTPMDKGGGTPVLSATSRWVGPGGESLLHTANGDIIVYHAYDAHTGRPALHISTIAWVDGWPSAALEGDGKP